MIGRHPYLHRSLVAAAAALGLLASACSSSGGASALPPGSGTVATTAPSATPTAAPPDQAELTALWNQVLDIFRAPDATRPGLVTALGDRIPTQQVLDLIPRSLIPGETIKITSNAVFTGSPDGTVAIVDCADAEGSSQLGLATAGFVATAAQSPAGKVVITNIDTRRNCVQQKLATAALASYEQLVANYTEFWRDPKVDSPLIGKYSTEKNTTAFRRYLSDLDDNNIGIKAGRRENYDILERSVEPVVYLPGQMNLRDCRHTKDTYGSFDGTGKRLDDFGPPWQEQIIVKMVLVNGQWLFDGAIGNSRELCQIGPSQTGLRPL